jgi:hypothetical protein
VGLISLPNPLTQLIQQLEVIVLTNGFEKLKLKCFITFNFANVTEENGRFVIIEIKHFPLKAFWSNQFA